MHSTLHLSARQTSRRLLGVSCSVIALCLSALLPVHHGHAAPAKKTLFRGMTTSVETSQDLLDLRALGANLVGYQINLNGGSTDNVDLATYSVMLTAKLDQLEGLLETCRVSGLKMLLILGTPPGGFSSRVPPAQHRFFIDADAQNAIITTWQAIATRFKGHPALYGYDIQNEPAQKDVASGLQNWFNLSRTLVSTIRAIDPDVRLVVEPVYGNGDKLPQLGRIVDSNLIYSVHPYFPSSIRNAGLNGRSPIVKYPTKKLNRARLAQSLQKTRAFQRKTKVEILAGEFAAPRWLPAVAIFLEDYYRIFESWGWDWAQHAWREADVWSVEHTSEFDKSTLSTTDTPMKKVLLKYLARNK